MSHDRIPLEVLSISSSFTTRSGYSVILKEIGGTRKLQMIVGPAEAQALAVSIEKIVTSRPLTHHFIQDILNDFCLSLKYILIYKYEDGIYYAQVMIEDGFGTTKSIDCRPSDAICMALKMDKPILALDKIFEETGVKSATILETIAQPDLLDYTQIDTSKLKRMLKDAIDKELFEVAAQIQNELNKR